MSGHTVKSGSRPLVEQPLEYLELPRRHLHKNARFSPLDRRHGNAIAVDDPVSENGGYARARREYACKVQLITARDPHVLPARFLAPDCTQGADSFRQSELLSARSCHEPAAPNFPAGLQAA